MWSGRQDSNLRPTVPKTVALPGCATPRLEDLLLYQIPSIKVSYKKKFRSAFKFIQIKQKIQNKLNCLIISAEIERHKSWGLDPKYYYIYL